jgi:predicted acetylornithine/succinylornithine family transaminase
MPTSLEQAKQLDLEFHTGLYARKDVMFVRGAGMHLFDDAGNEYLDFVSGLGAVNLGHAHPNVASAVAVQASLLVHVSNLYHVEHRAELAQKLVELSELEASVLFCNSGTEAAEAAIKLARRHGTSVRGSSCTKIVTALKGFHGRTMAALAATGQPEKQEPFAPMLTGFEHVPLNDVDALEAAVDDDTCAVMLEPVQGEGGVYPCTDEYLAAARAICDEHAALLILDEVQTGFYRTGPVFAWQGYGVEPDIMTLAKSLANGLPAGAVLAKRDIAAAFQPGDHGTTFGGGPVICAAALETLAQLEAAEAESNVAAVGTHLRSGLEQLAETTGAIAEVRGRGLMLAIELREPNAAWIVDAALERGFVLNNIGPSIVRFLPPLVCTTEDADRLLATLAALLEEGGGTS